MATQEERIVTLEQFRTETLLAYKDMAFEVTMVKGLTNDAIGRLAVLQHDVSEVKATLEQHTQMLNDIVSQLALVLQRLPGKE